MAFGVLSKQGLNKDIILVILLVMAKVTSKLQLTLPKAIAVQYRIRPGDNLDWLPAGEAIRVIKRNASEAVEAATAAATLAVTIKERLQLFDQATARQRKRQAAAGRQSPRTRIQSSGQGRGWTREEIYQRGLSR
jgi:bifunctional DNA-binding transcriptional regulator/antitoxin component of YhaV-PrlF toxin-antitoxin module